MGGIFGPVLSVWFIVIAILGLRSIIQYPAILAALNPLSAIGFIIRNGKISIIVIGSIFLAMTGAEVLYSDLGHFGHKPIRTAWYFLVYPALLLNYTGQGAFLLAHPGQCENLFYRLAPSWSVLPLVILADDSLYHPPLRRLSRARFRSPAKAHSLAFCRASKFATRPTRLSVRCTFLSSTGS